MIQTILCEGCGRTVRKTNYCANCGSRFNADGTQSQHPKMLASPAPQKQAKALKVPKLAPDGVWANTCSTCSSAVSNGNSVGVQGHYRVCSETGCAEKWVDPAPEWVNAKTQKIMSLELQFMEECLLHRVTSQKGDLSTAQQYRIMALAQKACNLLAFVSPVLAAYTPAPNKEQDVHRPESFMIYIRPCHNCSTQDPLGIFRLIKDCEAEFEEN